MTTATPDRGAISRVDTARNPVGHELKGCQVDTFTSWLAFTAPLLMHVDTYEHIAGP